YLLLLEAHLQDGDDTWTGLRIHAMVMVEEETEIPLASALRLATGDVDLTFHHRIRYFPRRSNRERYAPTSPRLERVMLPWLNHCGPDYVFPNHARTGPWDEVSARRELKARCVAAGVTRPVTFEQLQLCPGCPDPPGMGRRPGDEAASDIDFAGLSD